MDMSRDGTFFWGGAVLGLVPSVRSSPLRAALGSSLGVAEGGLAARRYVAEPNVEWGLQLPGAQSPWGRAPCYSEEGLTRGEDGAS